MLAVRPMPVCVPVRVPGSPTRMAECAQPPGSNGRQGAEAAACGVAPVPLPQPSPSSRERASQFWSG